MRTTTIYPSMAEALRAFRSAAPTTPSYGWEMEGFLEVMKAARGPFGIAEHYGEYTTIAECPGYEHDCIAHGCGTHYINVSETGVALLDDGDTIAEYGAVVRGSRV